MQAIPGHQGTRPEVPMKIPDKKRGDPPDSTRESRLAKDPVTAKATGTTSTVPQSHAKALPVVVTVAYRPAGRRFRWLAIIDNCPFCGEAHAHYGTTCSPPSGRRVAGCGRSYRLHPVFGGASDAQDVAVNR